MQTAREQLVDRLARYTDAHLLVQAQRAKLAILERQFTEKPSDASPGVTPASGGSPSSDKIENTATVKNRG